MQYNTVQYNLMQVIQNNKIRAFILPFVNITNKLITIPVSDLLTESFPQVSLNLLFENFRNL